MRSSVDIGELIVQSPEIAGGRPRVAGTGVSVRRIVGWQKQGLTPEEIAAQIPHLNLAQVHAALAFYYSDPAPIDSELAGEPVDYSSRLPIVVNRKM